MKHTRKILAVTLVAIMLLSTLTACSVEEVSVDGEYISGTTNPHNEIVEIKNPSEMTPTEQYWDELLSNHKDMLSLYEENEHWFCSDIAESQIFYYHLVDEALLPDGYTFNNPLDLGEGHERCIRMEDSVYDAEFVKAIVGERLLNEHINNLKDFISLHEKGILTEQFWLNEVLGLASLAECCISNDKDVRYGGVTYYSVSSSRRHENFKIADGKANDEFVEFVKSEIALLTEFAENPRDAKWDDFRLTWEY